jgi:preprotein translocase subunit SecD
VACLFILAAAVLSCGNSKDVSTSSSASPTSPPVLADPASRRVAMQERPVLGIVEYYSPEWKSTHLTCAPRDGELIQCIAATLDRDRIVLLSSSSRDRYILGPVVIDGADVVRAVAVRPDGIGEWHVDFKLTPDATKRFAVATTAAVGEQLALIIDGQVVSAPVVEEPIWHGSVAITGGYDEEEAKALAAELGGTA